MTRPLPIIGPPRPLTAPRIEMRALPNGLQIATVERRELPIVDLQVVFRFGAEIDDADHAGRLSMTAELLDEGTATRSALEIAEALDYLGAQLDISAGWDAVTLSLRVLSARLEPALDILADVLLNAAFPADDFRRKQAERISALEQERDEADVVAAKALSAGVFGRAHPYGVPPAGTVQSIRALTREATVAQYRELLQPSNAFVIAVGDIAADDITRSLELRLSNWTAAAVPYSAPPLPDEVRQARRVLLVHKPGAAQAELRVGHAGPPRRTDDYFALLVMNTILGASFTSRLNTILRERMGVTYGASSRFRLRKAGGLFAAGAAVDSEAAAESAAVVVRELQRMMAEPVSADELRRAQGYVAHGLPRSFETTEDIAAHVREQLLYELPEDYWRQYVERVFAVTPQAVQSAAVRHLRPDECTIVVVADEQDVRAPLEAAGLGDVLSTTVET